MWTSKPPFSSICSFLDGGFIQKRKNKNATQTVKLPSNSTQGSMKILVNEKKHKKLGQEEPTPPNQKKNQATPYYSAFTKHKLHYNNNKYVFAALQLFFTMVKMDTDSAY